MTSRSSFITARTASAPGLIALASSRWTGCARWAPSACASPSTSSRLIEASAGRSRALKRTLLEIGRLHAEKAGFAEGAEPAKRLDAGDSCCAERTEKIIAGGIGGLGVAALYRFGPRFDSQAHRSSEVVE